MRKKKQIYRLKHCSERVVVFTRVVTAIITCVALFAVVAFAVTPVRYEISVGQPAPNTIKATKDVNDMITTERLRAEAEASVNSIYTVDDAAAEEVGENLAGIFKTLRGFSGLLSSEAGAQLTDSQLESANDALTLIELDMEGLRALAETDGEKFDEITSLAASLVSETMEGNLKESQLEGAAEAIRIRLLENYDEGTVSVVMQAVTACLRPNYYYDEAATEAARQAVRGSVKTVSRIKGEVIVSDGELVTEAQYAMLDALGILKGSSMDLWLYVGLALLSTVLVITIGFYLYLFEKKVFESPKKIIMLSAICIITMLCCVLARELSVYVMPVTLGVLLVSVLINRRVSVLVNLLLAVFASMMAAANGSFFNMATYSVVISSIVSSMIALNITRKKQSRVTLLAAGAAMGLCNILCTYIVGLVSTSSYLDSLYTSLYSGLGGILSALLCVALMPVFESVFNVVTASRLIELSNPNQPLLRRLLTEAPGTYHHSIIVANLAEAAASEIGADGMLARVGAYYHDIGKLKRPLYFKENQMGDNPHDRTDPRVSAEIIMAHPTDGLQLLKDCRMPDEIREIVLSHHGNTPVVYFYNKCLEQNPEAKAEDFRYSCPRPASREAAVVMLADTVEAAARAMTNPNTEKLRELLEKLIRGKIEDGQLSECKLTFKDIITITESFMTVLSGAFHERIEYPTVQIPGPEAENGTGNH